MAKFTIAMFIGIQALLCPCKSPDRAGEGMLQWHSRLTITMENCLVDWLDSLRLSQQLWYCRDGQFT